ncbi:MAG: bifunctional protein-serine/threonine kinase/phosphatase [Gammaproteobacteria bacterium]|nr:MAG: bifunctional protein-serine/threonine kinase/phosphatase [Gammaproteobacteria bacterium]
MNAWHLKGNLTFSVGQFSSAGVKADNEDAIGIRIPEGVLLSTKGAAAIIADGVSAAEAGKEASETCVRNFLVDYFSTPDTWTVKKSTSQVLIALNRWLYSRGREFHEAKKGYVSTFSCVIFKSHAAHIFHVGDSRIYRYRSGKLEQLTRDHRTFISDQDSYLVRAMGLDVSLDVDCSIHDLEVGDIFLLTTDGMHDFLTPADISNSLTPITDNYDATCDKLAELALKNNSDDNISCQIIRVNSLPEENIEDATQKLTALPFPPHLDVGKIIDGYRIEKEIHASSRSQVYLVTDIESGERFCMKTPSVNFEYNTAYIERFVLESWIGSRIHNNHVVKIINPNKPKKFLYYLMAYIEGITLAQWIKENPKPPVQNVVYIAEQIVKGLRAFHRRETLHQDIRPANIMVDRNGEVKIIDFGACLVKGIAEIATPIQREKVLGTAEYSAPEHVLGATCSEQSDIFSLAVVIFEMLTGTQPFKGKLSQCRTPRAYLSTEYVPAYELNPLVPFWIEAAIKKGLRYDPERRHADVSEFLHELLQPNPKYKQQYRSILSNKKPQRVWQMISGVLFAALCVVSYLLLKKM